MLKSIGAVLGSYILSMLLVFASDLPLMKLFPGDFAKGHIPSNNALMASTACFAVVALLCAWICARIAPGSPAKHVLWLGILGEVMGLGFTISGWNSGWPHWYSLSWMVIWPIACWVGLMLAPKREARTAIA